MDAMQFLMDPETTSARVQRGVVAVVDGDALEVFVEELGQFQCDVLETGAHALMLRRGDRVLIWHSGRETERGIVLGRLSMHRPTTDAAVSTDERSAPVHTTCEVPEELVIEAKRALTLRVGTGSITICEDGRILIKGSDLVSHAQRTNRIRGGAVSIN